MRCQFCSATATQEYPIGDTWFPVCALHAKEFVDARPLGTPQQEKTEPSVTISASTEDMPAEVKFVRHEPTAPHSILQQAQKGDLSLLPGGPLNSVALAIASGLDKYPRDDWKREDLNLQEYASKAIRHTYEWLEGRDADPESGVDPLAHAVADLLFVIWHNQNWSGKAKRPGAEVSDG